MKIFIICILIGLFSPLAAQVELEDFISADGSTEIKGFFSFDKLLKSKRGGVLLIPDGDTPEKYIAEKAQELADLGFIVFVPALYAETKQRAGSTEAAPAEEEGQADPYHSQVLTALEVLSGHGKVDPGRLAAVGYGRGGQAALELARAGSEVKAVINYFGSLTAALPDENRRINTTVLVLLGSEDPERSEEEIAAFRQEMNQAGADWQINFYGGAVNSFTYYELGFDPSAGRAYHYNADKRSWEAVKELLREKLK